MVSRVANEWNRPGHSAPAGVTCTVERPKQQTSSARTSRGRPIIGAHRATGRPAGQTWLLDESGKIKVERIVSYVAPRAG
jgi:hypothetical protein